jgi:hypothetical protein
MKRIGFILGLFTVLLLVIALALPTAVLAQEGAAETEAQTSAAEEATEAATETEVQTGPAEAAESAAETEVQTSPEEAAESGAETEAQTGTAEEAAETETETTVTVNNTAPSADAGGPYTGDEGSAITLTGNATDPDNDVLTYEWDLDNDGTYETPGQTVSKTWPDNGSFTVGLKVTDDDAAQGTATTTVTVNNVAPSADAYL